MTRMKYIGAVPTSLANGQHVEPYTVVDVPQSKGEYAEHDRLMISGGLLIEIPAAPAKGADAKDKK